MTDTPAFPVPGLHRDTHNNGMTLRQYAAIKLRVPDSGTDWLDDMIRRSQKDYFAGQAIAGKLPMPGTMYEAIDYARFAYEMADAMIAAQEVK